MAINLSKGQTINLNKDQHDLSTITIGLGWKINQPKGGLLSGLFGAKPEDYDLDAIAFMMDENDQVRSLGGDKLIGSDVIFFNNLRHPSGDVYHSGDNRVGGTGAQDDEQIVVRLSSLGPQYHKILFLVCIYQGQQKGQHFGKVENAYMRAIDAKGKEIARYPLSSDPSYSGRCTMVFGEVYRKDGDWKFRAIGEAYPFDGFVELLKKHVC
jgi:tellurium resistance protein TerD